MNEDAQPVAQEVAGLRVQAGKQLCMSETIFPEGSRHVVNMLRCYETGGGDYPSGMARPSRRGSGPCCGEPWRAWER